MPELQHKIAEGNTAEIFEIGEKKVLKLFKTGYSKSTVQREYNNYCMVSRVKGRIARAKARAIFHIIFIKTFLCRLTKKM